MSVLLGDTELTVHRINTGERRSLIEHQVPGLDGSVFQDMGMEPVFVSLEGTMHGKEALADLEELRSKHQTGEPVPFTADIATATELTQVLIENLVVKELAGRPNYFQYMIRLRQHRNTQDGAMEQLQQGQIAEESVGEAASFINDTEKVVELDSGLREIGAETIKIGDQLTQVTDLLKELGLGNLFGYSAPTFNGKVLQVFDDFSEGLSGAAKEGELGGKVAGMVKTLALILGKAIFTEVSGADKDSWDLVLKRVGKAVSG